MDPRQYIFSDDRLAGCCVYCGGPAETRDHVPSRILLDDPLPEDLPVVAACARCNQGFSLDEEYLACLVDCVMVGTANPSRSHRDKIRRALEQNPSLTARLDACKRMDDGGRLIWKPEENRVRNVFLKLARGHAAFELGLPLLDAPLSVRICPLLAMSHEQQAAFEGASAGELRCWPEIVSRAFLRAGEFPPYSGQQGSWVVVQPGRYRYAVDQPGGVVVQIIIGEYLACRIEWE